MAERQTLIYTCLGVDSYHRLLHMRCDVLSSVYNLSIIKPNHNVICYVSVLNKAMHSTINHKINVGGNFYFIQC